MIDRSRDWIILLMKDWEAICSSAGPILKKILHHKGKSEKGLAKVGKGWVDRKSSLNFTWNFELLCNPDCARSFCEMFRSQKASSKGGCHGSSQTITGIHTWQRNGCSDVYRGFQRRKPGWSGWKMVGFSHREMVEYEGKVIALSQSKV